MNTTAPTKTKLNKKSNTKNLEIVAEVISTEAIENLVGATTHIKKVKKEQNEFIKPTVQQKPKKSEEVSVLVDPKQQKKDNTTNKIANSTPAKKEHKKIKNDKYVKGAKTNQTLQNELQNEIQNTAQRFDRILQQLGNSKLKEGKIPDGWETEMDLSHCTRHLKPGVANFLKGNKIAIDCQSPSQAEILKAILKTTDPKQPGKPTTTAPGFLKHFNHIARAATLRKEPEEALAKLIKIGEICCAFLEILEQKYEEITTDSSEKTMDIQVLGTKAEIIRHNNTEGTANPLTLLPGIGNPMQMVMLPGPSGVEVRMVCFNPQISLNYNTDETPLQKTLRKDHWQNMMTWIGMGLLVQAGIALILMAYKIFFKV